MQTLPKRLHGRNRTCSQPVAASRRNTAIWLGLVPTKPSTPMKTSKLSVHSSRCSLSGYGSQLLTFGTDTVFLVLAVGLAPTFIVRTCVRELGVHAATLAEVVILHVRTS